MSLQKPANTGGGSAVGFAYEDTWGVVKTSGTDPTKSFGPGHFMLVKEETFEPKVNSDAQLDDLDFNREIGRVISHGNTDDGSIRANIGPDSIGYFLTMLLGAPTTTRLLDSSGGFEAAYQHIWYPGVQTSRTNWPRPTSFESRLDSAKSKIIAGALMKQLGFELPNNAAAMLSADFLAKSIMIVPPTTGSGGKDANGDTYPCIMTANPTFLDENVWHFKQLKAFPQIAGADAQSVTSMSFALAFPDLHGIFTGGSGKEIGSYGVDKFQASGRATMLFEDETMFNKIKSGAYFSLVATLEGDIIQGAQKESLKAEFFSCLAAQPGLPNKVGDLEYDISFSCRRDPVANKSCQFTLVNSVASYTS